LHPEQSSGRAGAVRDAAVPGRLAPK